MDARAITKAEERLNSAREALAIIRHPRVKVPELRKAWFEFLLASYGLYAVLEQGSRSNGKSAAWFGRMKSERKKDELLSYVYHARNTEEHGLEVSTEHRKTSEIKEVKGDGVTMLPPEAAQPNHVTRFKSENGGNVTFKILLPGVYLVPVIDARFGDTFQPPTYHLGKEFKSRRPKEVAEAAYTYLTELVAQAAKLVS